MHTDRAAHTDRRVLAEELADQALDLVDERLDQLSLDQTAYLSRQNVIEAMIRQSRARDEQDIADASQIGL